MTIHGFSNWAQIGQFTGPCIRPGGSVLTERALKFCNLLPGSHIADVGCGAGGTLENLELTGIYRLVGLDHSDKLLGEAASRLTSGSLIRGQAETLPFKQGSLDAIFCECVLSMISDKITVLDECARVLKEGGFLIVSDLFYQGTPCAKVDKTESQKSTIERLLTEEGFTGLLEKLGFSVLLREEHKGFLKEFVARMILAGESLPDSWGCGRGREEKKTERQGISYFLLVGRKTGAAFLSLGNKGDNT
jgi:arsenite methyltransferase